MSDLLELDLQMVGNLHVGAGRELRSSEREFSHSSP